MSERAAPWGVKRRSWTASRTRRRVSSRTGPESFRARETVATDTRASRATSRIVAWRGPSGCRLRGDRVDTPRLDRRLGVNGYTVARPLSRKGAVNAVTARVSVEVRAKAERCLYGEVPMRVRRFASLLAAMVAIATLSACDDPLRPGDVAGTYVLRSMRGQELPAVLLGHD